MRRYDRKVGRFLHDFLISGSTQVPATSADGLAPYNGPGACAARILVTSEDRLAACRRPYGDVAHGAQHVIPVDIRGQGRGC